MSNAPCGRSLRDVNAKTKVTVRAIIYSIPGGKVEIASAIPKSVSFTQKAKKNPPKINMGTAVMATLEIRHINNSV